MALTPGTTIGTYEVTALIGQGGMGEVYQARDSKLDRDVALKVLPEAFTADPDRLARFEREAKVLASLNHPNIGTIYGLEESDGVRALVLELVEGPTLADRISQGPIPLDEALPIAKQIAEALEAAHEQGVIHRDLKPANIKVKSDGTVKVLDFGLAKAFQPDASDANMSMSPTISLTAAATQMGMVIGTAAYMAPEQAKGLPVDKRADIWAFGAVLFEMLTGRKLFEAEDVSEMLAAVLIKDPDISSIGGHVPAHIRAVIRRCLVKDPTQRVRDIGDVRLAMAGGFDQPAPVPAEPSELSVGVARLRLWQRPVPVLLGMLLAALVTGVGVWNLRPAETSPVSRFTLPAPGLSYGNLGRALAISPDGRTVVFRVSDEDGTPRLYQRPLDQLDALPIRGTEGALNPFFSPDGAWVAFSTFPEGSLKKVALAGGPPTNLTAGRPFFADWGPDGTIVFGRGGEEAGLWQLSDSGGEPRRIAAGGDSEERYADAQYILDGRAVLFTVFDTRTGRQVAVRSLDTGDQRILLEGTSARLTSTGHLLFTRADSLWAVPFDEDRLAVAGEPSPVLEGLATTSAQTGRFDVADDGTLVYLTEQAAFGPRVLVWVDQDGREEPIPLEPAAYYRPQLSPDGTRIAYSVENRENQDVWVADLLRPGVRIRVTTAPGRDRVPNWTPDGQSVVFESDRDGPLALFRKAADGTGEAEALVTVEGARFLHPSDYVPERQMLLVATWTTRTQTDLGALSLVGEPAWQTLLSTVANEGNPTVSPNAEWVAYRSDESGEAEVYVARFPTLERRQPVSVGGGWSPMWSGDGRRLFYRNEGRMMVVTVAMGATLTLGTPEVLFEGPYVSGLERAYDLGPDGRFLMMKPVRSEGEAVPQINVVLNWDKELLERVPVP